MSMEQAAFIPNLIAGKYRIVRKIGSGSFGEVHLAISVTNGEEVAVKMEHNVYKF